jgi:hypothetical protein
MISIHDIEWHKLPVILATFAAFAVPVALLLLWLFSGRSRRND